MSLLGLRRNRKIRDEDQGGTPRDGVAVQEDEFYWNDGDDAYYAGSLDIARADDLHGLGYGDGLLRLGREGSRTAREAGGERRRGTTSLSRLTQAIAGKERKRSQSGPMGLGLLRRRRRRRQPAAEAAEEVRRRAEALARRGSRLAVEAVGTGKEAAADALDTSGSLMRRARVATRSAPDAAEAARERAKIAARKSSEVAAGTVETAQDLVDSSKQAARGARRRGKQMLESSQKGFERALAAMPETPLQRKKTRGRLRQILLIAGLISGVAFIAYSLVKKALAPPTEQEWQSAASTTTPATDAYTSHSSPAQSTGPTSDFPRPSPVASTMTDPVSRPGNGGTAAAGLAEAQASPQHLLDMEVVDSEGGSLGKVAAVFGRNLDRRADWVRVEKSPSETHMLPLADATVGPDRIESPYTAEKVGSAPAFEGEILTETEEMSLYDYYGMTRTLPGTEAQRTTDAIALRRLAGRQT
jgi:hypothetical protein